MGNGSDECLALAVRTFVEPGQAVQYFTPSYSLYPVLADAHGAARRPVPLTADFGLPTVAGLRQARAWSFDAPLTLITSPNAPSGRGYATRDLEAITPPASRGVVIIDEVRGLRPGARDGAGPEASTRARGARFRRLLVCFLRVGYLVGHAISSPRSDKIRDS